MGCSQHIKCSCYFYVGHELKVRIGRICEQMDLHKLRVAAWKNGVLLLVHHAIPANMSICYRFVQSQGFLSCTQPQTAKYSTQPLKQLGSTACRGSVFGHACHDRPPSTQLKNIQAKNIGAHYKIQVFNQPKYRFLQAFYINSPPFSGV